MEKTLKREQSVLISSTKELGSTSVPEASALILGSTTQRSYKKKSSINIYFVLDSNADTSFLSWKEPFEGLMHLQTGVKQII